MSTTHAERPTTLDHQALDDIFASIAESAATSDNAKPVVESTPSRQSKQAPSFRSVQPRPRETPQAIPTDWFDVLSRTIMVGCVAGLMYLLLTSFSWSPLRKPRTESPAHVAVSQPKTKVVTEAIEKFDVGMRAAGSNPLRDQVETAPEPNPLTSRKLVLQLKKESGYRLTAKLLRSTAWMERAGVVDGGTFFLELPEMGAVGDAYVEAVLPCPPIAKGPGNVVTGVFEHEADPSTKILTVTFSNGDVIEGVTDNHPLFSVDRNDFVPVGEMREGETVKVVDGLTQITAIQSRFAMAGELLYNLETHNEHVYQVSNTGIVVHNTCTTTVIGRMDDLKHLDDMPNIDTWRRSGRIPGPDGHPVTWAENKRWLDERIARGDRFAIATNPNTLPPVKGGFIPGTPNGYFTARELEYLRSRGIDILEMFK